MLRGGEWRRVNATSQLVKRKDAEFENSVSMGRVEDSEVSQSSVALGLEVRTIGEGAVALGNNTVGGCKGYYMQSLDFINYIIYLSETKLDRLQEVGVADTNFPTPDYEVGDTFNIIINDHYIQCASIVSISNNVITYDTDIDLTDASYNVEVGFVPDDRFYGNTFSVPSKPEVGLVEITYASYAEGADTKSCGNYSHAEGLGSIAAANGAHAEGVNTIAGHSAHAEGYETQAIGIQSHAQGRQTRATGDSAHSEGTKTVASGNYSHAEGYNTAASNDCSHAEGGGTIASGQYSHAEGYISKAEGEQAHSEGNYTTASGNYAHAEGQGAVANGIASHAEGYMAQAEGNYSHAEGLGTIAHGVCMHVGGKYNIDNFFQDSLMMIGNGTSDSQRDIALLLSSNGNLNVSGSIISSGSDYAEYFEWQDGNINNEDRIGLLVTLEGEKIRPAESNDELLGIISGTESVIGDACEWNWHNKYLTDDFGRIQYEEVEEFHDRVISVNEETNEVITEKESLGFFKHPIVNPDYDSTQVYVNRANRPEWDTVGMLGKLYVRDDGTCQINKYVTISANEPGIATHSNEKTNMRVLSRVNENVIRVLLK